MSADAAASYPELGARVTGIVIDPEHWARESRVRRLRPTQVATGAVHVIYPNAPRVVGIRTRDGEDLHITVGGAR